MYKLLALDMDDTLLDENKILTEPVKNGLKKLVLKNVEVTLASGRFPASLWLHSKCIGLKTPLVALNGGAIVDPITGEPIKVNYIKKETALKIADFIYKNGSYVQFYGYNILFVEEVNDENKVWPLKNVVINPDLELNYNNYRNQANYIQVKAVGNINDFIKSGKSGIIKATLLDDNIKLVQKLYDEMIKWPEVTITRTGDRRFDINSGGISKKTALEYICFEKNIKREDVVVVGDYDNDIEMIKWAGYGVAMGNGNENVKKIAKYITSKNSEDGVAKLVDKMLASGQI